MSAHPILAILLTTLAIASAPACVVVSDKAGVPIGPADAAGIEPGVTTRAELLQRLGPPTGRYSTDLLAALTRLDPSVGAPASPERYDDDVLTWQQVEVKATAWFIPILFLKIRGDVHERTLTVFLEPDGRVHHVAYREDSE